VKTILIAKDGSDSTPCALDTAPEPAAGEGAEAVLAHVVAAESEGPTVEVANGHGRISRLPAAVAVEAEPSRLRDDRVQLAPAGE
jgi:hypothetical protein